MQIVFSRRFLTLFVFLIALSFAMNSVVFAQSRPQRPDTPKGNNKANQRPKPKTPEEIQKELEEKQRREEEENAIIVDDVVKVDINLVNVDAVVYNKKTGQIITGLKRENFGVFENGVKKDISNFSTPDAPITVSLVLEYSKWSEIFASYETRGFESPTTNMVRPVAYFLTHFIKAPDDYASVIAFDIRPTPITDFTNDPNRINQTINLLLRNRPAFRENNLFDAIKFALVGGRSDSVVLENSGEDKADYGGLVDVRAKRRAVILMATGIDTFSKTNYSEARKIVQNAGIPLYIISTGNFFYKKYGDQLPPTDSLTGFPGRLTFLQAQNAMNTFAKESGGMHYPVTFESELPSVLGQISTLLRNQYSLAYDAGEGRQAGKKYKLDVKVDVNGDGIYDDKQFEVQHRPFYKTPKEGDKDDDDDN